MKLSLYSLAGLIAIAPACAAGLDYARAGGPESNAARLADLSGGTDVDYSSWAVDPTVPGSDLPPLGRSLFDHLVSERTGNTKAYRVPFPFSALTDRIQARLAQQEYNGGTRVVMIPMGRSLQRAAAAPDFFKYPRIVFAVTGEPVTDERDAGMLLKDRLYVAYVEKTGVLEVISYNDAAGRFEFQLVKDYRPGGQPRVFYANRAICLSCHQNQAPIFSKPVWSETNANGRVAELLRSHRSDADLSSQANIDFPDDIDKATIRANAMVTLQSLWRRGCSDALNRPQSERCRAAAFTAVLQYGLSDGQDFDLSSPRFQNDFVAPFGRVWRQTWAQGLSVAQSNLPDRNPFGGAVSSYGGGGSGEVSLNWIAAAQVPAELDPLNLRPAREIWRFAGAMDAPRFIAGWTKFFALDDFRELDTLLAQQGRTEGAGRSVYQAQCAAVRDPSRATGFKLQCASDTSVAHGVDLAGRFDQLGGGRIDWLNLGPAGQLRDLEFGAGTVRRIGSEYVLDGVPKRKTLGARLPDGRALESVEIRWRAGIAQDRGVTPIEAHLNVVVVDDFILVRQAVDRLAAKQSWLFEGAPLARATLMRALFSELGGPARSWCCADSADMPPAMLDSPEASASALAMRELQPFFRNCAMCHHTHEQFPPNFLSGDATQVAENFRQCAPRMLVRLSAWDTPIHQRVKSPMPPAMFLQALGTTTERWSGSNELELLREYVEELTRREGRPTDVDELTKDGYEALPHCLPRP